MASLFRSPQKRDQAYADTQRRKTPKQRRQTIVKAIVIIAIAFFAFERFGIATKGIPPIDQARIAIESAMLDERFDQDSSSLKATEHSGIGYDSLSDRNKQVYEKLYKALWLQEEEIGFTNTTKTDMQKVSLMIKYDHPELFNVQAGGSYTAQTWNQSKQDAVITFHPAYTLEKAKLESYRSHLEKTIEQIMQGLNPTDSEKTKATYLHNWICNNVVYSEAAVGTVQNGHSTFDAICGDHAVCEGYALAFSLLCHEAGLNCQTIVGIASQSTEENNGHAWNRVMIDGEWRYVDVTGDDGPIISNYFFLKPQSFFDEEGYLPFKNNVPDENRMK